MLKNINGILLIGLLLLVGTQSGKAQLNPSHSFFYQNQYLYNPAAAGMTPGLNININYRQQWSGFPGAPKNGILTLDYQPTARVGIGMNINEDQAGLIRQKRVMGTYAYHLPLREDNRQLHFGLSLGLNDANVNYAALYGDMSDEEIVQYNQLKTYVDGDFGAAYSSNHFYMGAAVPNLKSVFFKSSYGGFFADRLLFVMLASYKIPFQSENRRFMLEPLIGYRAVNGYHDIFDVGLNFNLNNYGLYMQSVYHTSQSLSVAFGFDQDIYAINMSYDLETGRLTRYTKGAFEFGLKLRLFKKQ